MLTNLLTFLVVVLATFLGADALDLPVWLNALLTALLAGFAAIGIPARTATTTARRRA